MRHRVSGTKHQTDLNRSSTPPPLSESGQIRDDLISNRRVLLRRSPDIAADLGGLGRVQLGQCEWGAPVPAAHPAVFEPFGVGKTQAVHQLLAKLRCEAAYPQIVFHKNLCLEMHTIYVAVADYLCMFSVHKDW